MKRILTLDSNSGLPEVWHRSSHQALPMRLPVFRDQHLYHRCQYRTIMFSRCCVKWTMELASFTLRINGIYMSEPHGRGVDAGTWTLSSHRGASHVLANGTVMLNWLLRGSHQMGPLHVAISQTLTCASHCATASFHASLVVYMGIRISPRHVDRSGLAI